MNENIHTIPIVEIARRVVKNWEIFTRRDGSQVDYPLWSSEEMISTIPEFEAEIAKGDTIEIKGITPSWVMAVIVRLAYPKPVIFRRDEHTAARTEIIRMAEENEGINPEAGIEFWVKNEADNVFIEYKADDYTKPFTNGNHNYDISLLPKVRTPYVSPNSHVFLKGSAAYPVSLSMICTYFNKCKSISILDHDHPSYTCVASYCEERKVGDVMPEEP